MSTAMKSCPLCGQEILAVAVKCRHCRRYAKQIDRLGAEARQSWVPTDADESALKRIEQALKERSADTDPK